MNLAARAGSWARGWRNEPNMKVLNLAALALAVVLIVSWLSIVLYPSAQDFMRANPFWNGLRNFGDGFGAEFECGLAGESNLTRSSRDEPAQGD